VAAVEGRYLGFSQGVAQAAREGAPPPVDPADALQGLKIIAAARSGA
jgi:predicted dehydrogenase